MEGVPRSPLLLKFQNVYSPFRIDTAVSGKGWGGLGGSRRLLLLHRNTITSYTRSSCGRVNYIMHASDFDLDLFCHVLSLFKYLVVLRYR